MKMDIILSKWCLAILFAFGILACTDGSDANELPKEPEGTGETQDEKIPAFPGAEGHGRYTTGGRGGDVYIVTSLEDKLQDGTLRYGIEKLSGKRTIVFQVSGTIHLNGDLKIKNGDLTIAGQTAPGDGICLAGYPVFLEADNVIVRFMRFRMGNKEDVSADGADAFGGRYHRNIMIDHCSMSWCTDECVSFYQNENFTLQWCLISESLRLGGHTKGPHGYGGIWGGMKASFHHNLLAHHDSRNPRLGPGVNSTKENEIVDMRNNVIYNWCGNSCYGGEAMHVNIVNNFYKPGPATPTGTSKRGRIIAIDKKVSDSDKKSYPAIFDTWGDFFIQGNVVDDGQINGAADYDRCMKATKDNWEYGVYNQFDKKYGTLDEGTKKALKRTTPVETGTVTTHDARTAFERVMDYAGCSLHRDRVDERIVQETRTGTANYQGMNEHNGQGVVEGIDWKSVGYPKKGIIDSQDDVIPVGESSAWPELVQGVILKDWEAWNDRILAWKRNENIHYNLFDIKYRENGLIEEIMEWVGLSKLEEDIWTYTEKLIDFYKSYYKEEVLLENSVGLPDELQLALELKKQKEYCESGQDRKALEHLKNCLGIYPKLEKVMLTYAEMVRNKMQQQITEAKEAQEELQQMVISLKNIAKQKLESGETAAAKAILSQVQQYAPDDDEIKTLLHNLEEEVQ